MAVVGVAPCQCFSPGSNQTTSPGLISSIGPPSRWTQPRPKVTISVWPSGWVCQAVRAPGSKVTAAPCPRAGSAAENSGSMRTDPVNQSAGPLREGCEPPRLISMAKLHCALEGLVSRFLVDRLRLAEDVRIIDMPGPVFVFHVFDADRH